MTYLERVDEAVAAVRTRAGGAVPTWRSCSDPASEILRVS
jgi:hypothetical protein